MNAKYDIETGSQAVASLCPFSLLRHPSDLGLCWMDSVVLNRHPLLIQAHDTFDGLNRRTSALVLPTLSSTQ